MSKRIFISSTCYDLIDLRTELKVFLKDIGLIPVLSDHSDSEFSTEHNANSIEMCLINLRSCDTVIFILCQRYGGSLKTSGFGDFSATHLEYLEAKNTRKKILFFVRDRFEADFNTYRKTGDFKNLSWLNKPKDVRLFEIFEDWKLLTTEETDNWYWTFKNSIDVKERLKIELKSEIQKQRLDKIIESGNVPLLTVSVRAQVMENTQNEKIQLYFDVENSGTQTAIEPKFLLFKANSYQEVIAENMLVEPGNYSLKSLKSLPVSNEQSFSMTIALTQEELQSDPSRFVIEIIYKTIHGDLISDVSNLKLYCLLRPDINASTNYTVKRFRGASIYERLVLEE